MGKRLGRALGFAVLLTAVVAGAACNKNKNTDVLAQGGEGGQPPGMGGGPPGMMGGPGRRGPIGQTMSKLFRGPQSLQKSIERELDSESPSWDTVQPQTKEFADLAASVSKYDPPNGDKDSWTKLTTAFSEQATALDRAAAAKNKDNAKTAFGTISNSCKTCHDAHRGGPGGRMGPPGGFRGPGGPPKGPPAQPQ
jgi:hypothetical protein